MIAPMLGIQPLENAARQLDAINPDKVQALVATSRNAFTTLPAHKDFLDKPLYVVGDQTAAAAVAQRWNEPEYVAASSRALSPKLKKLKPKDGHIVYLRGEIVTTDLSSLLSDFTWHNIIAYRSIATPQFSDTILHAIQYGEISAVLLFSRRSAQLFEIALKGNIKGEIHPMHAYCLSEYVAQDLTLSCWKNVYCAAEPTQISLLSLVKDIHKQAA